MLVTLHQGDIFPTSVWLTDAIRFRSYTTTRGSFVELGMNEKWNSVCTKQKACRRSCTRRRVSRSILHMSIPVLRFTVGGLNCFNLIDSFDSFNIRLLFIIWCASSCQSKVIFPIIITTKKEISNVQDHFMIELRNSTSFFVNSCHHETK